MSRRPGTYGSQDLPALLLMMLWAGFCFYLSGEKPFWYDEFYTLHISDFTSWPRFLSNLQFGGDVNPPLLYLLPHVSRNLFGEHEVAIRLPFLLIYFTGSLLVYRMALRRMGVAYACLAMSVVMLKFRYAFEARSSALVLTSAILAVQGWLWRREGSRPRLGWALFTLGVLMSVSSHYYGCMILVPLGLAEAVRSLRRRALDFGLISALAAACILLLGFWFFIQPETGQLTPNHPMSVHRNSLLQAYLWYAGGVVPLAAGLSGLALLIGFCRKRNPDDSWLPAPVPPDEWALWGGCLLLPVFGYVLALTATGVFTPRYFMPMLLGIAMLSSLLLDRVFRGASAPAWLISGGLALWITGNMARDAIRYRQERTRLAQVEAEIQHQPAHIPIVSIDYPEFIKYQYYLAPDVAEKIIGLREKPTEESGRRGVWALSGIARFEFTPLEDFISESDSPVYLLEAHAVLPRKQILSHLGPKPAPPL